MYTYTYTNTHTYIHTYIHMRAHIHPQTQRIRINLSKELLVIYLKNIYTKQKSSLISKSNGTFSGTNAGIKNDGLLSNNLYYKNSNQNLIIQNLLMKTSSPE